MKERKPTAQNGSMNLIYGETGVGKTVSTLLTCPRPCLYVEIDPKPVERTAGELVNFDKVDIVHPDNFLDLFTYLAEKKEEIARKYRCIVIDPFSFLINVVLLGDLEDETARAGVFGKNERPLMNMGRTDLSGYGSLASLAKRLCKILGDIAISGVHVICISLLDEAPKWDRELVAAPAFAGKEFNRDYPAYFDNIGLVTREDNRDFPIVTFYDAENRSFIRKWSGARKDIVKGELRWDKILNLKTKKGGEKSE